MDKLEQSNKQQQTLDSIAKGKVIAAKEVHEWLNSWGMDKELEAPKFKEKTIEFRATIQE